jgi:hypothetical protein
MAPPNEHRKNCQAHASYRRARSVRTHRISGSLCAFQFRLLLLLFLMLLDQCRGDREDCWKRKKQSPMPGPNSFAMIPAIAVINPPNTNRTAYSCHVVSARGERLTRIFIGLSETDVPESESSTEPHKD